MGWLWTSPPTIISVKGNPVSGFYTDNDANPTSSDVVLIEILFSENVTVDTSSGTPTLELETGDNDRDAVYMFQEVAMQRSHSLTQFKMEI